MRPRDPDPAVEYLIRKFRKRVVAALRDYAYRWDEDNYTPLNESIQTELLDLSQKLENVPACGIEALS